MSILSLVLHDMHLPHALNQGVHHLGRSETSRRRPRSRRASLAGQVDVGHSSAAIARAPAHFNAINRAMAHVSDRQAAPACSQTVYMVSAALMVVGSAMGTP